MNNTAEYNDIEIDITLSVYANARNMFVSKKHAQVKEIKTLEASAKALDTVEHQVAKAMSKQKIITNLKAIRKVHWFEKFHWFISSEGYLVLSGRDAQQNELLVKKYMRQEDIYVHANLNGKFIHWIVLNNLRSIYMCINNSFYVRLIIYSFYYYYCNLL